MNLKEYFKQQIMESIIQETFAEIEASQGLDAAREHASSFAGRMGKFHERRAERGQGFSQDEAERIENMYRAHTGADVYSGSRDWRSPRDSSPAGDKYRGIHNFQSNERGGRDTEREPSTVLPSIVDIRKGDAQPGHQTDSLRAGVVHPETQKGSEDRAKKLGDKARAGRRGEAAAAAASAAAADRQRKLTI